MEATITNEIKQIMTTLGYNFEVKDFITKAKWWDVSTKCDLSEDFIDYFADKVSWLAISKIHAINFSDDFFNKYKHRINVCKMNESCTI